MGWKARDLPCCMMAKRAYYFRYFLLSSVRPSVSPQMPARFSLEGFTWYLILMTSVKICLDIPGFVEFGHLIWSPNYVLLLTVALNRHTGFVFKWHFIRLLWYLRWCNITKTRYNITFYVRCLSFFSTTKKHFPALLFQRIQESYPAYTAAGS
jgi:hypothetical protein